MYGQNRELVQLRQQDVARESRSRRWAGELRNGRRRDGSLWIFRPPPALVLLPPLPLQLRHGSRHTGVRGRFRSRS